MLKPCAECGQQVSTQALTCPHCGNRPVNSCDACFEYHLSLAKDPSHPCHSPHGVCPAFVDYMSGSLIELLNAKQPKMHDQLT